MSSEPFTYIWQYSVDPDHQTEFLAAYHPSGEWAQFFSRDPGYLRTELFRDSTQVDRYMTIDYWTSEQARDSFREKFAGDFDKLDQRCEAYTVSENFIGDFVLVDHTAS